MIDLNQPEIQTLQQSIRNVICNHEINNGTDDYDEGDRYLLVTLFTKYLNALQISVTELGLPTNSNQIKLLDNSELCQWEQYDTAITLKNVSIDNNHPQALQPNTNIDVYIWLDGIIQPTAYNQDLGGLFDPYNGYELIEALDNPDIIIDQVRGVIYELVNALDDEFDNDDSDY